MNSIDADTFNPNAPITVMPQVFPVSDLQHSRLQSRLDILREKSRVALQAEKSHALSDAEIREAIEVIACLRRTHTGAAKAKKPAKGKAPAPSLDDLLA